MTTAYRGVPIQLVAMWRTFPGGALAPVTSVQVAITSLSTGAVVIAQTATGVATPATGVNTYTWTPSGALDTGQFLVSWTGEDADLDSVSATEVVTLQVGGTLGGPYATRAAAKKRLSIPDSSTSRDDEVDEMLLSGADAINRWCGRQFGRDEDVSTRSFVWGPTGLDTSDFYTTTGLVIDDVAWDDVTPPYTLLPRNGVVDDVPGWPYNRLESLWTGHPIQPIYGGESLVTARWGWATIPPGITQANLMLMSDDLKSGDAPFGVAGFGDYVVRIRANPKVQEKLDPYVLTKFKVAS